GTLESRADRRPVPPRAPPADQSRNHLSAHLGRQASRRQLAHPPARRPEAVPQTLPALRQPRPARRQTADHAAPHDRRRPRPGRGGRGDWEADTGRGAEGNGHCVLSLVERKTGYLLLGKLPARTVAAVNQRARRLLRQQPRPVHTLTCDNGTEFHGYATLEAAT